MVRYDLRDSGESTTADPEAPAYTLRDLAADAAADDHPGTAGCDDVAELFEHDGGSVQVDGEDDRGGRLAGRDAGRVDDAGDITNDVAVWTSS